jgi:hypothetical protein
MANSRDQNVKIKSSHQTQENQNKMADEDDFFKFKHSASNERHNYYDGPKKPRLGCTCWTLVILLVAILLGLAVLVILATRNPTNILELKSINTKLAQPTSSLKQQLTEKLQGDETTTDIVLTEEELSYQLAKQKPNTTAVIQPDGIYITSKIYGLNGYAEIVPSVDGNKLKFETKIIRIGSLKVPSAAGYPLTANINSALRNLNTDLSSIDVTSVELQHGAMIITGKVVGR